MEQNLHTNGLQVITSLKQIIEPLKNQKPPKIKFFFVIKHENSGKIESHLWFFKGFCAPTNPTYCQMIDAGTIPKKNSVSRIVKYMDTYQQCGGASGEIEVFMQNKSELGYGWKKITDTKKIQNLNLAQKLGEDEERYQNYDELK